LRLEARGREIVFEEAGPRRMVARLPEPGLLVDAVRSLLGYDPDAYLEAITATDMPEEGVVELSYLFWSPRLGSVVSLKTRVPRDRPEVDSLAGLLPAAVPYEMEAYDLAGVVFRGNPRLREGFLKPEDMRGVFPLRKDSGARGAGGR
jgi:NADH-quinone oxidoreductase subunit C